jgi:hypothetical protein
MGCNFIQHSVYTTRWYDRNQSRDQLMEHAPQMLTSFNIQNAIKVGGIPTCWAAPHSRMEVGIEVLYRPLPRCRLHWTLSGHFLVVSPSHSQGALGIKFPLILPGSTNKCMETVQQAFPVLGRGETLRSYFTMQGFLKMPPSPTLLVHLGGFGLALQVLDSIYTGSSGLSGYPSCISCRKNQQEMSRIQILLLSEQASPPPLPRIQHTRARGNTHTCCKVHAHTSPEGTL